jgi:hypothetical protein
MSNIDKTLAERGTRYGEFPEHASITQGLKDAMSKGCNWDSLDDDMKEALEMVAHKIGRILNGDPNYIDSWTDIIGYTRLVEKRLIDGQAAVKALLKDNVVLIGTLSGRNKSAEPAAKTAQCDCLGCPRCQNSCRLRFSAGYPHRSDISCTENLIHIIPPNSRSRRCSKRGIAVRVQF